MNPKTKSYQITCLFSPLLEQAKLNEIIQKIKQAIADLDGSISSLETETSLANLIKKKLSYPIKKYQEAFYSSFQFLLPPKMLKQFQQRLDSEEDIIRYLITVKQKPKSKGIKESFDFKLVDKIEPLSAKTRATDRPISDKKPERKTERPIKEKVKIEELDQKLEEILKE